MIELEQQSSRFFSLLRSTLSCSIHTTRIFVAHLMKHLFLAILSIDLDALHAKASSQEEAEEDRADTRADFTGLPCAYSTGEAVASRAQFACLHCSSCTTPAASRLATRPLYWSLRPLSILVAPLD